MTRATPYVEANGFYNPFTGMKKWTIDCGKCDHSWKEKVPVKEKCSAICPNCKTQNVWSYSGFMKRYEERIET